MANRGEIALIGGHLACDFTNTVGWHAGDDRVEHLSDYAALARWAARSGAVDGTTAAALRREALRHPERARRALARVIELREALFRVFSAIARRRSPAPDDLRRLHEARLEALRRAVPRWTSGGRALALGWEAGSSDLLRPLHPIALAAADLLASPDLSRLRQCGNHPCGWLFLDASRNGTRRWCSAGECGNLVRVRRFRAERGRRRT